MWEKEEVDSWEEEREREVKLRGPLGSCGREEDSTSVSMSITSMAEEEAGERGDGYV